MAALLGAATAPSSEVVLTATNLTCSLTLAMSHMNAWLLVVTRRPGSSSSKDQGSFEPRFADCLITPERLHHGRHAARVRSGALPYPPTLWVVVGLVPDVVADAPRPGWDRRLELPFTLEVAAA